MPRTTITRWSRGWRWVGAGTALALVGALTWVPLEASADPSVKPRSGDVTVRGRGYGHGTGMSQYGAYGAARRGLNWRQILGFYYPGTTRSALPAGSTIRVWVTADSDGDLRVRPAAGLRLSDANGGRYALPRGSAYRTWRVTRSGAGYRLSYRSGSGAWRTKATGLSSSTWTFSSSAAVVAVVMPSGAVREYRGSVALVKRGSSGRTVNRVTMENYVRSVVPSEMPTSWLPQAVASQAVAARTYAAWGRAVASGRAGYDICDTTACQVYAGMASTVNGRRTVRETARGNAAVAATRNVILRYRSAIAFTQFSSANGGHSAQGGYRYLRAQPDPYDGVVKSQAWTRSLRASRIAARWSVGRLRSVRITRRDGHGPWGGRVHQITVAGSRRTVTISGLTFKRAFGLRDTLFTFGGVSAGAEPTATLPPPRATPPPPTATLPRGARYATFPRSYAASSRADLLLITPGGSLTRRPASARGLGASTTIATGFARYTHVVNAGDWNGDGYQDVVVRTKAGRLRLFPGTRTGRLGRSVTMRRSAPFRALTSVGDLSGDGRPDLLAITRAGNLRLYPGNGRTGVRRSKRLARGWDDHDWLRGIGDLTRDGRPDLVTRRGGRLYLYPGRAGGLAGARRIAVSTSGLASITSLGDFDGDRRSDLVGRTSAGRLLLYRGTSARTFSAPRRLSGSFARHRFAV